MILVTGATGTVGRQVVAQLSDPGAPTHGSTGSLPTGVSTRFARPADARPRTDGSRPTSSGYGSVPCPSPRQRQSFSE